jgi:hypothetical protein
MKKVAALEPTGVTDSASSSPIYVSTTTRILYRAKNPMWKRVSNKELNLVIAKQFSAAKHDKFFKPKKAAPNLVGETRISGSTKFIALDFKNQIWVIAVGKNSNPTISAPAPKVIEAPSPVVTENSTEKTASRDDWLRSHRGFLENHYFDMFQGMYALDVAGFESMKRRAKESGDAVKFFRDLHGQGKDAVSNLVAQQLHELSERGIMRDPDVTGRSGLLAPPEGMPLGST